MLLQRKYESRLASSNSSSGRSSRRRLGLDQEEEPGGGQDRRQRDLHAALEALAAVVGQAEESDQAIDLLGRHRATEGPLGEPGDDLAGAVEPRFVAEARLTEQDPPVRLRQILGREPNRAVDDHRIDVQAAVGPVALVAADVGGDLRRLRHGLPLSNLPGARATWTESIPLGDLEPVAIDDRLVLHADGLDGPTVLAEADHQPGRRDRFGDRRPAPG